MASRRARAIAWLLFPAIAALSAPAVAAPTPQQKELARDLMQKGYAARNAHDLKTALESFKAADDIMHVPTTGFEVARSQADLGLLVEAHETLVEVMRAPEKPGEPAAFHEARGYAKVLDGQLAPRIPQLKISVSGASSPSVSVDGVDLPEGGLLVPYKVDPGHHVVIAKAGDSSGRSEVDVAEGESKDVWVQLQSPSQATAPAPAPAPAPPPVESPEPESSPAHHGLGPVAWTGFGIAVVGVGVGSVIGAMTLSDKSSIASQCNGTQCPPSTYDKIDSANTLATVSTIAFAAGGAGAILGLAAWYFGWGVEPTVGVGSIGLRGRF